MVTLPQVGLTMGDPAGVGPELMLRALADQRLRKHSRLVLFGDMGVLQRCARELNLPLPQTVIDEQSMSDLPSLRDINKSVAVVQVGELEMDSFEPCQVSAACGQASFRYVQASITAAQNGWIDGVVTGPLNKEAMNSAGIHFPGHTEIFAERTHDPAHPNRWCMMQYSEPITCTFATVHVGYHEVPELLTEQRVLDTIELTHEALMKIRKRNPKLVVCGLNPHAGENGLFGQGEEQRAIIPAIKLAQQKGIDVEGPLPGDTAFLPWRRDCTDAFICMYHDQGHIPLKALAFDQAVNTTLGLKIIRTSVDHGTAFDIAWGRATEDRRPSDSSLIAAIRLATKLATT